METEITKCKIVNRFFRNDRWYIILDQAYQGRKTMQCSRYIWLQENPAFKTIPKGYVIHHLDHDETNNDISNLALMQKNHHAAHHWKYKRLNTEITVDPQFNNFSRTEYLPTTEPKIYQRSDNGKFTVQFAERVDGKRKLTKVCSYRGETFKTKEEAEVFKSLIWQSATGE